MTTNFNVVTKLELQKQFNKRCYTFERELKLLFQAYLEKPYLEEVV